MWEPGLPAMQAPRSVSQNQAMPSQASQLPQGFGVAVERVVDQYRQCPGTHNHCPFPQR